jgi:hypothetical protein
MYGAEIWVLSTADELRLGVFERRIFKESMDPYVKRQHGDQDTMFKYTYVYFHHLTIIIGTT